ncbi:HAD-superfamily hydrolase, subfamily IA, variant 1 [Dissulfuribacter thermophilus]|uniref:phosphoglycolate phosphatase n=1 Tax=Dissulfuribacter thermophilus TaxID=1156395 RepID=A0A1B9F8T3_9BACT|nr:HAD family hydrolase [Dissulfuribacter thermophilus]OCC16293.1 HAD-superfamily hydrolase, subfamily IA, variant 1 [Dissulfuribacter thermophilus]
MNRKLDQIKLLIFDCDGVLFDSRKANFEYYNRICSLAGRPPITEEEFHFVHMHTAEESVKFLFRNFPELMDQALDIARNLSYDDFIQYMEFEPGVPDVLSEIKKKRFFTAISTNRSTTMPLLVKMFDLKKWFDLIVCALDVSKPKPHPEGVQKILDHFGVSNELAMYIGDSEVDEKVAKRAGIPLIAYKNPALNAMFHVKHFNQILNILPENR